MSQASEEAPSERLVLRPGWFLVTTWMLSAFAFLLVGAIGWESILGGAPNELGWIFAAGGTVACAILIALVLRCRLILSPEGFRLRRLWRGRLVQWSTVKTFAAIDDVGAPAFVSRGVSWEPLDPTAPGLRRWTSTYLTYGRFEIPVFGGSREHMLKTLQSWLSTYSRGISPL